MFSLPILSFLLAFKSEHHVLWLKPKPVNVHFAGVLLTRLQECGPRLSNKQRHVLPWGTMKQQMSHECCRFEGNLRLSFHLCCVRMGGPAVTRRQPLHVNACMHLPLRLVRRRNSLSSSCALAPLSRAAEDPGGLHTVGARGVTMNSL